MQVHNIGLEEVARIQEGVQEVITMLGQNTSAREFSSLIRKDKTQVILCTRYPIILVITAGIHQ